MSYQNPQQEPSSRRPPQETDPTPQESAWALRIATVFGIPIRLHFTFLLIIIWVALSGIGKAGGAGLVLSVLGLFLCVALHELGHSVVAQRFGYIVRDITLYPIGGVASIEGSPRPRHELYIALAGPAVNVVIALLIGGYLAVVGKLPPVSEILARDFTLFSNPWTLLLTANVWLVIFNMIPAFPMDGGRVLRAVLGLSLGKVRATQIAASLGQFLAIFMGIIGVTGLHFGPFNIPGGNLGLIVIALFVYFGAGQEKQVEQTRVVVEDAPVSAAMLKEFQTLTVGDTLKRAAEVLLATSQQDFPVVHGDTVEGVLSRNQLLRGLAEEGEGAYVAGVMTREVLFTSPNTPLEPILMRPDGVQRAPILVQNDAGQLVGMLTLDNLMEFLTLRQIAQQREEEGE
jgi:Zn-dependent protease